MSRQAVVWGLLGVVVLFVALGVYRAYRSDGSMIKNQTAVQKENNLTSSATSAKATHQADSNKTESAQINTTSSLLA